MAYSNRVCHLIDGGRACPDVALLYHGESKWAGGVCSDVSAARAFATSQIDFHVIPSDVFACLEKSGKDRSTDPDASLGESGVDDSTGSVKNGERQAADAVFCVDDSAGCVKSDEKAKASETEHVAYNDYPVKFDGKTLVVNGVSYGALVLPGCDFVEPGVADFIEKALASGFPVLFLDQKPSGITAAAKEENTRFAGLIAGCETIPAKEAGAYAAKVMRPQTIADPSWQRLVTYHYQNGADLWLLLNEHADACYRGRVTLAGEGTPVRYDPWQNRLLIVEYQKTERGIVVETEIDPLELMIIVLDQDGTLLAQAKPAAMYGGTATELTEFMVHRVTSKEYLAGSGIAASEPEQVCAPFTGMQKKYPSFSGYYVYETDVKTTAGRGFRIEMEDVCESAEVFVNGTSVGMRLQRPFAFEIPGELVKEENRIRIEVATLLERKLHGEGVEIRGMSPYRPLSATGIVGKVTVSDVVSD